MVQGMAFLSKKGFNPHNNTNRKQVWEAQQHSKQEKERLRKRQEQLQKEKEDQELELATRGEIGGSQAQLRFMYDAPPGMETKETKNGNKKSGTQKTSDTDDLSQIQPGDDAAAVAFRQMLAAAAASNGNQDEDPVNDNNDQNDADKTFKFTPSLQGSMVEADSRYNKKEGDDANEGDVKKAPSRDSRSALEKEVGRKNRSTQNNLSYEQQIERFPQLKNAPMAVKRGGADGDSDKPMMVHFKPLGSQILHVRCLACGIWGHQKGDRECQKSGWNPFAMPSSSSSILPPKRSEKESKREEKDRRRERSEESDRRKHRRRRRRDDSEDSSVDSFRRRRKKRYKEHYASSDESNSDPSSEDSSKLKRRNDDRYDSSEDERRHRKRRKEKKRSRRHESSSHRKKKKKRRHSSP
mmetsp:Transcript_10441/g.21739  ORF Transcript_10441/g.21739 Transcript_10441/m.21739 type:complete len:410 (-) Transcript_10441:118-1347(-)|eukprot:CAMPEP_0197282694 /NCGR_PEP_ID=MMETSP1432-20130617/24524_1 /TAXON_ID=44447 /ORGANISM="Pseudo-nitzschia delicatissima, Strain UNC1205" /LENGTH=409 /DNA_ID=CAMNT_0042749667 /DNA_START=186 /DNA_END=1415 /DNA_ORIENTATION=-